MRSFILRLLQILTTCAALQTLLMGVTLFLNQQQGPAMPLFYFSAGLGLAVLTLFFVVRQYDPELVSECARWLYPGGAILCLLVALLFAQALYNQLENPEIQHWTLISAGILQAAFLIYRIWDIKWLRSIDELQHAQRMRAAYDAAYEAEIGKTE